MRIVSMDPNLVGKLVNQFTRMMARAIDLDVMGESQKPSKFYGVCFGTIGKGKVVCFFLLL